MDIVIRKYQDTDLDSVNNILNEAFQKQKENFSDDNFYEVVAQCNEKVVGYLLLTKVLNPIKNKYYYLVDYVCVLSEYRGLGISDKMMEYAEKIVRENKGLYIQLTCSRNREAAHKLYERCGYEKRDSDIYRKVII